MRVTCHDLLPLPLAEDLLPRQGLWGSDFSISAGERVLVSSPSGRGKTTLLHILYGIRHDYCGTVCLDGADIRTFSAHDWLQVRRQHLSLVFQDLRLFETSTALDSVEMVRLLTGSVSSGRVLEMAEALGIITLLDQPCALLSFGQRQRVALLRALSRPFTLLLLDEPFSHLDSAAAECAASVIADRLTENKASLIITGLGDDCPLPVSYRYRV